MIKSPIRIPKKYLSEFTLDGMKGRLLHLPHPKGVKPKKTIVFVHGQHASLERYYTLMQFLNRYGEVYMMDLPGFGGMDSFYSAGKTPTYDNYADFLHQFLESRGLTKDIRMLSMSFGAQVKTRMLQKYPESVKWFSQLLSLGGFVGGQDFNFKFPFLKTFIYMLAYSGQTRLGVVIIDFLVFNRVSTRLWMFFFIRLKAKMQADNNNLKEQMVQMEMSLWAVGDHRTHARSTIMMFRDDLRRYKGKRKIQAELYNIAVDSDQYFDNSLVERDFKELYKGYEQIPMSMNAHVPSMIAEADEIGQMIPQKIRTLLER